MAEIRIKNVPEELKGILKTEAKRLGIDERAVMLMRLWGSQSAPHRGSEETPNGDRKGALKSPRFIPPTEDEALVEILTKGYHFGAKEFVAWNGARGWKTRQGPMKDWRQAMVTWEGRWKEKRAQQLDEGNPFGKRPPPMADVREIVRQQKAEAEREE